MKKKTSKARKAMDLETGRAEQHVQRLKILYRKMVEKQKRGISHES